MEDIVSFLDSKFAKLDKKKKQKAKRQKVAEEQFKEKVPGLMEALKESKGSQEVTLSDKILYHCIVPQTPSSEGPKQLKKLLKQENIYEDLKTKIFFTGKNALGEEVVLDQEGASMNEKRAMQARKE